MMSETDSIYEIPDWFTQRTIPKLSPREADDSMSNDIGKLESAIADLLNARKSDSLTEYPKNETLDIAIQAMKEKLERDLEPDGWIKCSKKLPALWETVIVCTGDGEVFEAWYGANTDSGCHYGWYRYNGVSISFDNAPDCTITYWQPLPKPTKEEKP